MFKLGYALKFSIDDGWVAARELKRLNAGWLQSVDPPSSINKYLYTVCWAGPSPDSASYGLILRRGRNRHEYEYRLNCLIESLSFLEGTSTSLLRDPSSVHALNAPFYERGRYSEALWGILYQQGISAESFLSTLFAQNGAELVREQGVDVKLICLEPAHIDLGMSWENAERLLSQWMGSALEQSESEPIIRASVQVSVPPSASHETSSAKMSPEEGGMHPVHPSSWVTSGSFDLHRPELDVAMRFMQEPGRALVIHGARGSGRSWMLGRLFEASQLQSGGAIGGVFLDMRTLLLGVETETALYAAMLERLLEGLHAFLPDREELLLPLRAEQVSPGRHFMQILEREVLPALSRRVDVFLDDADLSELSSHGRTELLGVLSRWMIASASSPRWRMLRPVLTTLRHPEAHLPTSSFEGVSHLISLPDFSREQCLELFLNARLSPSPESMDLVMSSLGGHPRLTVALLSSATGQSDLFMFIQRYLERLKLELRRALEVLMRRQPGEAWLEILQRLKKQYCGWMVARSGDSDRDLLLSDGEREGGMLDLPDEQVAPLMSLGVLTETAPGIFRARFGVLIDAIGALHLPTAQSAEEAAGGPHDPPPPISSPLP